MREHSIFTDGMFWLQVTESYNVIPRSETEPKLNEELAERPDRTIPPMILQPRPVTQSGPRRMPDLLYL